MNPVKTVFLLSDIVPEKSWINANGNMKNGIERRTCPTSALKEDLRSGMRARIEFPFNGPMKDPRYIARSFLLITVFLISYALSPCALQSPLFSSSLLLCESMPIPQPNTGHKNQSLSGVNTRLEIISTALITRYAVR